MVLSKLLTLSVSLRCLLPDHSLHSIFFHVTVLFGKSIKCDLTLAVVAISLKKMLKNEKREFEEYSIQTLTHQLLLVSA